MKETEPKHEDPVAEVRQVQHKKKLQLIGSMVPGDGHKLFEFNKQSLVLQVVDTSKATQSPAFFGKKHGSENKQFKCKENCLYLFALNFKSAVRKLQKKYGVPYVVTVEDEQPAAKSC